MLSHDDLITLIGAEQPIVEEMVNTEAQVQQNGIELTLHSLETFNGIGQVAFDNSERKLPDMKKLEFDTEDWIFLSKGIYKIKFNEIVNIPKNIAAIAKCRSSVMRCGVDIIAGVWDAGYRGRSEALIVVYNEAGFRVKKNARLLQLLFFKLNKTVDNGYSGMYLHENTKI